MRPAIAIFTLIGLLAVIIGAVLHISVKRVHACSYPGPPPMKEVLKGADLAFVGKIISIDRQQIKGDERPTFEEIIEFKTSVVWKGEPYETMFVRTTWFLPAKSGPSDCPPNPTFAEGRRYIVFVRQGETHLSVNSSTQEFDYAPKDQIAALGVGEMPIPGSVSPTPEREGQPVDWWSRGGCGLTPSYALGNINLSAIGLTALLAWFWLRQRFRR